MAQPYRPVVKVNRTENIPQGLKPASILPHFRHG
jgi:hypothetical protein